MVGNSLLLDGVDVERLQQSTSGSLRVYWLFLEGTGYFDWFYGLARLFRHGARPQAVVVGLGLDGLLDNAVRQEYAPRMLFDARDIVAASSEVGLDRTVASSLLLAHWSAFWDMRHVIRVQILTHTVPYYEGLYLADLWSHLRAKRVVPFSPETELTATARLQRLRDLCEAYGTRLLILVPPTPSVPSAVRQLTAVAEKAAVTTIMPVDPSTMPVRFFRADGIHVNEDGATFFTSALASELPARVADERLARSGEITPVSRTR